MSDIFDSDRRRRGRLGTEPATPNPEDSAEMDARLTKLEHRLITICGEDGTNGKLGHLRGEVGGHSKLIKAIGAAALSGVLGAAGALYSAGVKSGAREQEYQFIRAEVASLRSEVHDLRALMPALRFMTAPKASSGDLP